MPGVAQTQDQSFDFNGESDLDLEYAMALTNPQPITLLQTGDLVEGRSGEQGGGRSNWFFPSLSGAGFDNWLDAVDKSFCTFEGGDDPTQVRRRILPWSVIFFIVAIRMEFTPILNQEALTVNQNSSR